MLTVATGTRMARRGPLIRSLLAIVRGRSPRSVLVRGLGCHVGCPRDPGWCRTMPVDRLVSGVLGGSGMLAG